MPRRFVLLALTCITAAAVGGLALAVTAAVRAQSPAPLSATLADATAGLRFNFLHYELNHFPNRLLQQAAALFGAEPLDETEALARWFGGADQSDAVRVAAEWHLEQRLSEAAAALGLASPLPLFDGARLVWPPVDLDLSAPLRVLTVSRRDEVRLIATVLLHDGVPQAQFAEIEAMVEAQGDWSAYVTTVGGVSLYPAQVIEGRSYASTLRISAHEWTHHYLSFHPLGLRYGQGAEMRTLNETVADLVGNELGAAALLPPDTFQPPDDSEVVQRRQDLRSRTDPILRQLRLDVETLLAEGKVDEAEALMETTRLELIALGRPLRRINQAFLAFSGSYGANPASASQWGGRLRAERAQSASLAEFLERVRVITSPAHADQLLPPP